MKKLLLALFILLSVKSYAQITGGFYIGNDLYGNRIIYFQGQNKTWSNYDIKISCVNESLNQKKNFTIRINSGNSFNIGPNEGWYWQPGEKLYITYANGSSHYWTYGASQSNPSFTGQKYDCERCLCRGYVKKSTYNSDCKVCGHPKRWHYSQK